MADELASEELRAEEQPGYELREYRRGDAQAMYLLDIICFERVFRFSRRAMQGFAEAEGAVTLLAEADGRLIGFEIVQQEAQKGYVVTLDIAPEWRRRGLARRLMSEMEMRVATAGGSAMELHVFEGNAGAVRLYEAMGYEQTGVAEGFYGRRRDGLVYVKRLDR